MSKLVILDQFRKEKAGELFSITEMPIDIVPAEPTPIRETWMSRILGFGFSTERAKELFMTTRTAALYSLVNELKENLGHDATIEILEKELGRVILDKVKRYDR